MKPRYLTEEQFRRENPELFREFIERQHEREQQKKKISREFPPIACLECESTYLYPGSRYCRKHHNLYTHIQQQEAKKCLTKGKNYAYSERGFNEGMNAYVKDKDHYKKLEKKLKKEEGLEHY